MTSSATGVLATLVSPDGRREQTLELLLRWFEARAGTAPVCLVVEDTHWIDPSTRELLNRLARREATVPLLLVTSRRPDDGAGWEPPAGHEPLAVHRQHLVGAVHQVGEHELLEDRCAQVEPDARVDQPVHLR